MTHDHDPDFTNPKLNGATPMTDAERIAEVLYQHPMWSEGFYAGRPGWAVWCSGCDAPLADADTLIAHQAEMVAAALEPVIRERERVAWREGFKQGGPMHDVNYEDPDAHTRNPYETTEEA